MSIDLSKLTPAPWELDGADFDGQTYISAPPAVRGGSGPLVAVCGSGYVDNEANATFIALARNAFDVLDRRHVDVFNAVAFMLGGVLKTHEQRHKLSHWLVSQDFTDIFTALVEADRWISDKEKA